MGDFLGGKDAAGSCDQLRNAAELQQQLGATRGVITLQIGGAIGKMGREAARITLLHYFPRWDITLLPLLLTAMVLSSV